MTEPPKISVVMPVLDVEHTVLQAVQAVLAQATDFEFELVVVDNGSTDRTRLLLAGLGDPRLRVVDEPTTGLNRARNTGVRHARADLVALCDGDDEVCTGWLPALYHGLGEAELVGGRLLLRALNTDETRQRWGLGESVATTRTQYDFLPAPYGANCGFRRAAWDALGGFDERFSSGGDDFEFFWRGQMHGFRFQHIAEAGVQYRLRGTWRAIARRQFRFGKANVDVYRRFRGDGLPRSSTAVAVRSWLWLALNAPVAAVIRERRGEWLRVGARRAGRLVRSVRSKTAYL